MNKIPRIFCVTLKETPIRSKTFSEMAVKMGIDYTFFYGVFGSRMKLTPRLPNDLECPGQNIFMTDGAVGCYLSHYILWHVLQYQPDDEFLIVEDDAIFVDGFVEKFQQLYSRLPSNWDMVYVGWLPFGDGVDKLVVDEGITIRQLSATHAYLIKKSALKLACDSIQPCSSPLDLTIGTKLLPCIKYYVFDPPLATQRSFQNSGDPIWNSLVYDWKSDLYGVRRKFTKQLALGDGWHNLERNEKTSWRWSNAAFVLQIPSNIESVCIECSTPVENALTITIGENISSFPLSPGDNTLEIKTKGGSKLEGKIKFPYAPAEHDKNSSDPRTLGICLRKLILRVGATDVAVDVQEISSLNPTPSISTMSFKL